MDELLNEFNDITKAIEPYVKAYGTYGSMFIAGKGIIKRIVSSVKNFSRRQYYDINEVLNELEAGQISIGDIIETSGFLLKYGQVFKPYTHIHGMFSNITKGEDKIKYDVKGRKVIGSTMVMSSKIFQPPIQKIPANNGIGCAFLYDSRFTGFIHKGNESSEEIIKENPILVNEYSRPIIVLYNIAKQEKYINKEINIKGRIFTVPREVIGNLNGIFDNTIRDICSNFFRPYNENINFICISLLDAECSVKEISQINNITEFKAPFYVETQAEGLSKLSKNEAQRFIETMLPNLPQKLDPNFPFTVGTFTNNIGIPFFSTNNINVIYREPEVIGFYMEISLFEPEEYKQGIKDFTTFINNFNIDYKNKVKKHLGGKQDIKLSFLSDYEKQYLFDKRGVLNSDCARALYNDDDASRYVMDWLKNDGAKL